MDEKAQGAIEYLLLLAGAILVAVAVLAFMAQVTPAGTHAANGQLNEFLHLVG